MFVVVAKPLRQALSQPLSSRFILKSKTFDPVDFLPGFFMRLFLFCSCAIPAIEAQFFGVDAHKVRRFRFSIELLSLQFLNQVAFEWSLDQHCRLKSAPRIQKSTAFIRRFGGGHRWAFFMRGIRGSPIDSG